MIVLQGGERSTLGNESAPPDDKPDDKPARQWGRTQQTRRQILDAAKEVFREDGYAHANIAHIVERSGLSVGSVYHHFSAKADLFRALWEETEAEYNDAAASAVAAARQHGESDPIELFLVGARAYLEVARDNPEDDIVFRGGDGPPELDVVGGQLGSGWVDANLSLLGLGDDIMNRMLVRILTWVVVEGERAIIRLDDPAEIESAIERVLDIVRRIAR